MKLRNFFILLALLPLLFYGIPADAQTVHSVNAGDNTLYDAVQIAADGDIIELVDGGGVYLYNLSDRIDIDSSLTIRAREDLTTKPILRNDNGTSPNTRYFEVGSSASLILIGLEFDGSQDGGGDPYAKNGVRVDVDDSTTCNLKIYDCYFHDYTEQFVKGYNQTVLDTVIIENSIFDNAEREGILMYESSNDGPAVNYARIENCTITRVGREAIKFGSLDVGYNPELIINHCTFDSISIGAGRNQRVINTSSGITDATITNVIMSNQLGNYDVSLDLYGTSSISYSDTFNVRPVDDNGQGTIGLGMIDADPMYTDAANGDYTPLPGSQVLGAANDGFAMGDLRWDVTAQGPTIHRINAGENTLYDAVQLAEDGDIIELVDGGGVYLYARSDRIDIEKSLIIRAREGLSARPILRNDNGTSPNTRQLEVGVTADLTLIGLEFDGSQDGGGVPYAKNGVRVDVDDSTTCNLKIYDCYFHDYTEQFVKGYNQSVLDTVIIENSIFDNAQREGILMYESSNDGPAVNYARIENCTITRVGREAIKFGSLDVGYNPELIINHCTFDSISIGSGRNQRVINTSSGITNATITNVIMSNQLGTFDVSLDLYGTSSISYSDTFNVKPVDDNGQGTIGLGMIDADPMYNDPANNDYRLALASLARNAGNDGRAMGDLRWEADPAQFLLTIEVEGSGLVVADPVGPYYAPGSNVTLTADPDPGWEFVGWDPADITFPPDNPVATVNMDANKTVTATFQSTQPTFQVTISTLGLGTVVADPEPMEGGLYFEGTEVTLTAVPDTATWAFEFWSGDLSGSVNPETVTVDSAIDITANFASMLTQFRLTLESDGLGSIGVDPAPILGALDTVATYDTATVVEVTAEADLGWEFSGWSGGLSGSVNPDTVQMDSNITLTAMFSEIVLPRQALEIDTTWDLRDAVEFANNNSGVDSLILITSGGLYTSTNTSDVAVTAPLTVIAAPGLEEKPVITNSDPEAENDDMFRVFDDFTIKGVIFDGGLPQTHGPKYAIRLRHYSGSDSVKEGTNITVMDCEFRDLFENKIPTSDGHAFKIDWPILAGTIRFENCTFIRTGYEAIRISDTERWLTDRTLDSLIVRNCTFVDIDAECIRYYSDLEPTTPDAPVIIEHLTINNSATRTMYLKNSGGAIVRDIIISNSRTSGHSRDDDLLDAQGNGAFPSFVSHIDTFNVLPVPIEAADGQVDSTTIFGFDPMYTDPDNLDFTLLAGSQAYGAGHDGSALGDLRWVDPAVSIEELVEGYVPLTYSLDQNYPNPFNPSTTIRFALKQPGETTLKIFDVIGREVVTLVNEKMDAGVHEITFQDLSLASGVYFYQIRSGNFIATKKMLMLK